jgi:hypothetical protein
MTKNQSPDEPKVSTSVSLTASAVLASDRQEVPMTKFLITAAALSLLAAAPASAKPMMSCSGDGMMKVNNMSMAMANGQQKMMMDREIGMANMAMSKGDMRTCNKHLMNAQRIGMMKPQNDMMGGGMMGSGMMMPMMPMTGGNMKRM